jgi:hypothetical protein
VNDFKIPFFRLSKPCGTGPRPPKRTGSPGTRAGLEVSEMLETAANDHKPGVTSDRAPKEDATLHEIVIVGGGAAGLDLATGVGNTLARRKRAQITLVDKAREFLHRRLLRAFNVSFALQDARGCAARTRECDPRYDWPKLSPTQRARGEASLEPIRVSEAQCAEVGDGEGDRRRIMRVSKPPLLGRLGHVGLSASRKSVPIYMKRRKRDMSPELSLLLQITVGTGVIAAAAS